MKWGIRIYNQNEEKLGTSCLNWKIPTLHKKPAKARPVASRSPPPPSTPKFFPPYRLNATPHKRTAPPPPSLCEPVFSWPLNSEHNRGAREHHARKTSTTSCVPLTPTCTCQEGSQWLVDNVTRVTVNLFVHKKFDFSRLFWWNIQLEWLTMLPV